MRKIAFLFAFIALLFGAVSSVSAKGIDDPNGVPLYVIIEVDWDGHSANGDWAVWGPKWEPVVGGTLLTGCPNCLEMSSYDFAFHGKTVHFNEVYVDTVTATPQSHNVVLKDGDGDGTYTGSLPAAHYFAWGPEPGGSWPILYFDRIDYEISFDGEGEITDFHYLQYEHKKLEQ